MTFDLGGFAGLVVAILGGEAVGVERQRSGHATGPDARLGGIRTGKQDAGFAEGNVFFDREFPLLDRIKTATITDKRF